MFELVRLKLSFYYLIIIMLISLSFSFFIYHRLGIQFRRSFRRMEQHLQTTDEHHRLGRFMQQDLDHFRNRVLFLLIYTNGVILVLSATAGYFLAGQTLKPIEDAMKKESRFVANASHELKTPLTSLKTNIEVDL
ncbi:hypothetical protein DRH14_03170, partial [Candidatus Shapirobacteria bacterium]